MEDDLGLQLIVAATKGDAEAVRKILATGEADPNARDEFGETAMTWAQVGLAEAKGAAEKNPDSPDLRKRVSDFQQVVEMLEVAGTIAAICELRRARHEGHEDLGERTRITIGRMSPRTLQIRPTDLVPRSRFKEPGKK